MLTWHAILGATAGEHVIVQVTYVGYISRLERPSDQCRSNVGPAQTETKMPFWWHFCHWPDRKCRQWRKCRQNDNVSLSMNVDSFSHAGPVAAPAPPTTVCGYCCSQGQSEVFFLGDLDYTPDDNIVVTDDQATIHRNDDILLLSLSKTALNQSSPSVTIDIDIPNDNMSTVDVELLRIHGNVATADLHYKVLDLTAYWTMSHRAVIASGSTQVIDFLSGTVARLGMLELRPLTTIDSDDTTFEMQIEIMGCKISPSMSERVDCKAVMCYLSFDIISILICCFLDLIFFPGLSVSFTDI